MWAGMAYMLGEVWRTLNDFPNYEVSHFGRIRYKSKPLTDKKHIKRTGRERTSPKVRKTSRDKDGYEVVTLFRDGERIHTRKVHRLVATVFLDNPNQLPQVNHKDGIKDDNSIGNLEWSTPSKNLLHAFSTGLHTGIGTTHPRNALTEEQVRDVRRHGKLKDISQTEIAKRLNVSRGCVSNIVYRKTWKHLLEEEF